MGNISKQMMAVSLLLLALTPAAYAWKSTDTAQAQPATAAYEAGDYAKAATLFRMLADKGNAYAQFYLGVMYSQGQHVRQNPKEAMQWYLLAAEQGFSSAQYELGRIYSEGQDIPHDYKKSLRWYRAAAQQNYPLAHLRVGQMYERGLGVMQDDREAVKMYLLAAEEGNALALRNLGVAYGMGHGVKEDHIQAYMWLTLALAHAENEDQRRECNDLLEMARRKMTPRQIVSAQRRADTCTTNRLKDC